MRQVPLDFKYLIIGSGKMATHFCHYLTCLGYPYAQWARQTHSKDDLKPLLANATHVLVLISDKAIGDFIQTQVLPQARPAHQIILHFSGQLTIDGAYSTHPLGTFPSTLYPNEMYYQVPFILSQTSPELAALLPGLSNPSFKIPAAQKAYYHALCVLSNNFSVILWKKFFQELENTLQLPPQIGLSYLSQTFYNLSHHPNSANTGPLARKDLSTIAANLQALEHDSFCRIYEAFVNLENI